MKKLLVTLVIMVTIVLVFAMLLKNKNEKLDVLNPLIERQWSYAKVPNVRELDKLTKKQLKASQNYKNIVSYNKHGEKNNYLLDFKGYDPTRKYVKIDHKGKWVFFIEYISKSEYEKMISND